VLGGTLPLVDQPITVELAATMCQTPALAAWRGVPTKTSRSSVPS
jgi:hypothetical protein